MLTKSIISMRYSVTKKDSLGKSEKKKGKGLQLNMCTFWLRWRALKAGRQEVRCIEFYEKEVRTIEFKEAGS